MAVDDAYVFPGFLTPVLTQLFFPKPPTTFLTCFCRGKRRKYAGKKSRLNRGSNSQPPCHESDTLTTEPPGRGNKRSARFPPLLMQNRKVLRHLIIDVVCKGFDFLPNNNILVHILFTSWYTSCSHLGTHLVHIQTTNSLWLDPLPYDKF